MADVCKHILIYAKAVQAEQREKSEEEEGRVGDGHIYNMCRSVVRAGEV
jgi:hypothetical protein